MMIDLSSVIWQKTLPSYLSPLLTDLMTTSGSLTVALNQVCGRSVRVQLLFEDVLSINEIERYWVREVLLWCCEKPMLYAVSKVLLDGHDGEQAFLSGEHSFSELKMLGEQPLGYWLAKQKDLMRSDFEYALICNVNLQIKKYISLTAQGLPARRSSLRRLGQSLELIEVFLIENDEIKQT